MPGAPIISTDCGTSSSIAMRCPSPCGIAVGTAKAWPWRQAVEHGVDQLAGALRIDIADDADLEIVAREEVVRCRLEIVGGDGRHRAAACRARRAGVGMVGERGRPPALIGKLVRARGRAAQSGEDLLANALEVFAIEPRLGKREPQQLECLDPGFPTTCATSRRCNRASR